MKIYLIPFIVCLTIAMVPCIIQLLVCLATEKLWIRLVPMVLSVICCLSYFLPHLSRGDAIGNAFEGLFLQCMIAALAIAHGLPFLILDRKK